MRERAPTREIFASEQRDRAGTHRRRGPAILILRMRQAAPSDAACKAELVQPLGSIIFYARGEHLRFPGRSGELKAIEQFQNGMNAFRSFSAVTRVHPLPREKKSLELCDADRLYFGSQPVNREPMNPRQQPAITPFDFLDTRMEFSAKDK